MEKIEFRTHKHDRVRLKADVTSVYPHARAYMEGWVRHQRYDDLGYPMVWIEWDKRHWAYNEENDGWTLESHFDIVKSKESKVSDDKRMEEVLREAFEKFLQEQAASLHGEDITPSEPVEEEYTYEAEAQAAFETIQEADVFYVFTVTKKERGGGQALIPTVFSFYRNGDDDECVPLIEATISDTAASLHARASMKEINRMQKSKDKDNG